MSTEVQWNSVAKPQTQTNEPAYSSEHLKTTSLQQNRDDKESLEYTRTFGKVS